MGSFVPPSVYFDRELPYIFAVKASFSAYLLGKILLKIWENVHFSTKQKARPILVVLFVPSLFLFSLKMAKTCCFRPSKRQTSTQKTRPPPYLYIVSLVIILRSWVCDNFVYQFPIFLQKVDSENSFDNPQPPILAKKYAPKICHSLQRYFSYRAILVAIVSQSYFVLVFVGYRTIIARYDAKWGIAQMCLCKIKYQGGSRTILVTANQVSCDMGYRSDSIAMSRDMEPLRP